MSDADEPRANEDVADAVVEPVEALVLQRTKGTGQVSPTDLVRRARAGELLPLPIDDGLDGPRGPLGMATDAQADAFRELRTMLLSMSEGVGLERFTTLVVPLTSGSGGSFVARNLAAAFTFQNGQPAMLIDCDVRHPTQHEALRTTNEGGLFDFLDDDKTPVDRLLRSTAIPGLLLIPAGQPRSRYREYFSSPGMEALMGAIRQSGYFVVLDGPPVQGSPDARIIASLVDYVVMVVGYGHGTPDEIAKAAATFPSAKFTGVVFNERGR